jgi:hypothetical protein
MGRSAAAAMSLLMVRERFFLGVKPDRTFSFLLVDKILRVQVLLVLV